MEKKAKREKVMKTLELSKKWVKASHCLRKETGLLCHSMSPMAVVAIVRREIRHFVLESTLDLQVAHMVRCQRLNHDFF